jgi:acid phosphatase
MSNGNHTILAKAYQSGGTLLGQSSITINVQNGTSPTATPKPTATSTPAPSGVPQESHVFLLLEENHSSAEVTSSSMPYLISLESKAAIATNYFANTHPSLPDYMWLTTGGDGGFTSDVCPTATDVDNIVRELAAAGLTWKAYEESIPSAGYLGCDVGSYMAHHDPFAYFIDVRNDPSQAAQIVPFSQLATDIKNGTLPGFGFITPNIYDNAHTGTLTQADSWLKTNIAPLLNSAPFKSGGHGMLIIVFDEGIDDTNGGGQVFWLAIGPDVKHGYSTAKFYQHENTLKLIADALNFPPSGSAVNADDMAEVF